MFEASVVFLKSSPVSTQCLFKLRFKFISVIKAKLLKNWILEEVYKLPKIHADKRTSGYTVVLYTSVSSTSSPPSTD